MAATVRTEYTYPITDTLNDEVNTGSLGDELSEASLSVSVGNISLAGSNVIIELLGDATAADLAIVDGVIAAHEGLSYQELPIIHYENETAVSDDSGNQVQVVEVETDPLHAGKHMIHWSAEIATTDDTGTPRARFHCSLQREGQPEYGKGEFSNDMSQWKHVTVPFVFHAAEGQRFTFRIYYQRTGSVGNPARIRRARISLNRAE